MPTPEQIRRLQDAIEERDVAAARKREANLEQFRFIAADLRAGCLPSPVIRDWLAEAFDAIASGTAADVALGTARKRKRPSGQFADRDLRIYMEAEDAARAGTPLKGSRDQEGAYDRIGAKFSLSSKSIERVHTSLRTRIANALADKKSPK